MNSWFYNRGFYRKDAHRGIIHFMQRNDLLVWMDLEMTSLLDATVDSILEIAVVLTDNDLNIVAEGPDIVIHADPEAFDRVPAEVLSLHERSGVRQASIGSSVSEAEAEREVLSFLKEHISEKSSPLCGNSIWVDRHFLRVRMPSIHEYLDYRVIDVSTIKELAKRWNRDAFSKYSKVKKHRAKDDILQSIEELRFWKKEFLGF